MSNRRVINGAQAILEATKLAMQNDARVYIMGEGVADPKGIFGTTSGLLERFGELRVIETPVSENGFTGAAIGSALLGQRPIVTHQRVDFSLLSIEQLFNNAAKSHYVSAGKHSVPIVVRMIIGRGWGQGPAHSQSLESMFGHIPGLKVVMPSNACDAKGMLLAAIEDDNPVIFLEHRWIHYNESFVDEDWYEVDLAGPEKLIEGSQVTVVASSYITNEARVAVEHLSTCGGGGSAELFDLRVIRPLQLEKIFQSVRKTGKLLVVDTGHRTYGVGAEIVAQVTENCFSELRAKPERIGLPDYPTPSTRGLIRNYYPDVILIADKLATMTHMSDDNRLAMRAILTELRNKTPFDIPHADFRGPF